MTDKPYHGDDVITNTYLALIERTDAREITLPRKARAIVADDSDGHRTREGYVRYNSAHLFETNGHAWAIMNGEGHGPYSSSPGFSDLLAVSLETLDADDLILQEVLTKDARRNSWFNHSLIWSDGLDGKLKTCDRLEERPHRRPQLSKRLLQSVREHTLTTSHREPISLFFDGVSGCYTYRPEIASALAECLLAYFANPTEE